MSIAAGPDRSREIFPRRQLIPRLLNQAGRDGLELAGQVQQVVQENPKLLILPLAGLLIARQSRPREASAAPACPPQSTDGRPALCTTVADDERWTGESQFGGFYFEDKNGNGTYDQGDVAVQGVKDRQILVEEIAAAGSSDYVQLNPNSRRIVSIDGKPTVFYDDIKGGNNPRERFVSRWTVFRIPSDGGVGIGIDVRTGMDRLVVAASAGETIDKIWGPIDPEVREQTDACGGKCGWNCERWIQFSRLKAGATFDLNGVVPTDQIHRDRETGLLSSYTDYVHLWETPELAERHRDYSRISTPLTDALRKSEGVVPSYVLIPRATVRYNNNSR